MPNPDTAHAKDGWLLLGPGGGGCVHSLTVNPHRPDTLVVSCDMTGGYLTHDGGRAWREFNLKSRQYAYAFDPIDPEVLYVGTSGLFRSEDNGVTWRLIFPDPQEVTDELRLGDEAAHEFISSDNWPGGTIHAILIDPQKPEHIFIAIKKSGALRPVDPFSNRTRSGFYIFASTDRGQTWIQQAELDCADFHLLTLDPSSPMTARALFAFTEKALYKISAQNNVEQIALPKSVIGLRHASCGINPENGQAVFYISAIGKNRVEQFGSFIWKTTNLGDTWERSETGLTTSDPYDSPVFSQVSACACDARVVYLIAEKFPEITAAGQRAERYGILRSADEGQSWEWVVKMDDDSDPTNRSGGWAERDYGARWGDIKGDEQINPKGRFAWDVVASPVDPRVCYTMDFSTIFKTSDGGATWEQLVTQVYDDGSVSSRGIDVLSTYGVFFDPFDAQHLALSITDVGVFHSQNGGRTWRHALNGVPRAWINTCYWMVFDPQVQGRAWSVWAAMHDLPRLKMCRAEFFAKYEGGICKTNDGMQTWQPVANGLPHHAICTHIVLDPASAINQRTLYAAVQNDGVYKSTDDGLTWTRKNNGIDARNLFAWRLLLLPNNTLYLVVVKNRMKGREFTGALYKSTDGAETWEPLPLPAQVDFPNDLTCDSDGRLYLACWPCALGGENRGGGAYVSVDGGQSWSLIFDPAAHVYSVSVDTHQTTLYAACFHAGVQRSRDRGQSWQSLPGADFRWNHRVIPDPHQAGMIYLTTFGCSIWYGCGSS